LWLASFCFGHKAISFDAERNGTYLPAPILYPQSAKGREKGVP